jgi:two-component system KDP operon response regulator KdpE
LSKFLVLVVEDDQPVRNLITTTLKANDYRYITAAAGEQAVMAAASHNPDIILLDLGLPDIDGVEVIHRVRSWSNVPIIVISARSEDADKIDALDAGADDYLTKPFSVEELLARLRVTIRRIVRMQGAGAESPIYENGALRIDFASGCAFLENEELRLTPIEYKLLSVLAANTGKVLTHRYILEKVWGGSWEKDVGSLRVYMATLRKKLESGDGNHQYIQTHIGIGYRMLRIE